MGEAWSIGKLLVEMAGRCEHPAVAAVRSDGVETWSYARVADHASRLAAGLLQAGLEPDEPVVVFAPNMPEWIVTGLAVGAAGGTLVPIDDISDGGEVATIVADSGARFAFTTSDHIVALRDVPGGDAPKLYLLDADGGETIAGEQSWRDLLADDTGDLPEVGSERPAALFYTSGTTGSAKAFHLSRGNIAANVTAILDLGVVGPGDRALLPLPMHHAYPWIIGVLTVLSYGTTVVLPEGATGPQILHALRTAGVTLVIGVPRLYEAVVAGIEAKAAARGAVAGRVFKTLLGLSVRTRQSLGIDLGRWLLHPVRREIGPGLRLLVSGGARLEPKTMTKLEALGWEVFSGYGLAETASMFTANLPPKRLGSEGRPVTEGKIRIADADEDGIGEIQLSGPSVFAGYRNNPDANRAAFTKDGWFRTGDLGCLDGDGYIFVTGRAKELIVLAGGKNIVPEDLEKAYGAHPFIAEVAVLERAGSLVALVRPDPDALRLAGATRVDDAVRVALSSVAHELPSYQRLTGFAVARDPLPRTRLGKYRRFQLPDLYQQALDGRQKPTSAPLSDEEKTILAQSPAKEVWRLLVGRFPDQPVNLDTSPTLDLGMDSFAWMTFVVELEKSLGIRLTEEDVARIQTVRDLLAEATAAAGRAAGSASPLSIEIEREAAHWLAPVGPLHRVVGATLYGLNWLTIRALFRLEVEGLERLPTGGAHVLAANHASDLDPLVLSAALPVASMRRVYWGGDVVRLFSNGVARWLCRAAHVYPVDEHKPAAALAMAAAVLHRGLVQVWFPEAWRSPDGKLQRFLPGVGKLIADTRVSVVPVYIAGTFEALPRHRRWPRLYPIRIVFGEPVHADELASADREADENARIASALRERVADLARSIGGDPGPM